MLHSQRATSSLETEGTVKQVCGSDSQYTQIGRPMVVAPHLARNEFIRFANKIKVTRAAYSCQEGAATVTGYEIKLSLNISSKDCSERIKP